MDISLTAYLIVCPLVFLGGFVDAIAGGGGLITLPAYLLAGVPIHSALATNKLSSVLGASVSAFRFWRGKFINLGFIFPSVIAALIGSAIGARLTLLVEPKYLEYMLIGVLPVAAYMVFKPKTFNETPNESMSRPRAMTAAAMISLLIGGYDGFYGPGTGTFLMLLYSSMAGMDIRSAAGSAKMVNFASNISAFVLFLLSGKTLVCLGLTAAVFSIAGHWFGAGLAIKQGGRIVRPVVLVVLSMLFLKIIFDH